MLETIFALSSGALPAAIAVVRISGPGAFAALEGLAGGITPDRRACLRTLKGTEGRILDRALVIAFPGPDSSTGEDLVELHLHGGRAVVAAVLTELAQFDGLRMAEPGEFTRRSFEHGRIDLNQAEALSDLLSAETEWQRRAASTMAGGRFGHEIERWRESLLLLSAMIEAQLDFSNEDDVAGASGSAENVLFERTSILAKELRGHLEQPSSDRLRNGIRVVISGPPNSGKSSLLNAIVSREAAIVSDIAGTTRDVIEIPVSLHGIAYQFSDTAGLRTHADDPIEMIGMERARLAIEHADILLWLGEEGQGPEHRHLIEIDAKSDIAPVSKSSVAVRLSAESGVGIAQLIDRLGEIALEMLPAPDAFALNARQRKAIEEAASALEQFQHESDMLLQAEQLRVVRAAFDRLTGRTHTEDMLDYIFSGFCIGK